LFCLLGITMNLVVESILRKRASVRLVLIVPAAYLVFHTLLMIKLHPYEYVYYNRIIGGVAGASRKGYVTEYWATSYKEAVKELTRYLQTRDGTEFASKRYKILVGPAAAGAIYYFPANFVYFPANAAAFREVFDADAYLSITRYGLEPNKGTTIVEVGRFGIPFAVARQLEH